jgi:ADP-ribose pyrophosphatase YjhB (NUDIX family)
MTLGVRAVVQCDADRILLVRHAYKPGWHLPGGGVEPGETVLESLARELKEEVGIRLAGPVPCVGLYANREVSRRDHVALFLVRNFDTPAGWEPDGEIAATQWACPSALPPECEPGVERRIAEVLDAEPKSPIW